MAFLSDNALDSGLSYLTTNGGRAAQQKATVYRLELEYSQLWFDDDEEDIEVLLVS